MDHRFQYRHAGPVALPLLGLELWPCHVYELYSTEAICGRLYMGTNYMVLDLPQGPMMIVEEFHFWKRNRIWIRDPFTAENVAEIRFPYSLWNNRLPFSATLDFADGRSYYMDQAVAGRNWFTGTRYHPGIFNMKGPGLELSYRGRRRIRKVEQLQWEIQFEGFLHGMSEEHLLPAMAGFYLLDRGLHWHSGE